MRNLKKYLLLLLAAPALSFSQETKEELIDWSSNRLLTWADYKGAPRRFSDAAASTTTYLGLEYQAGQGKFTYTIQCRFSATKSWGAAKTDYILKHEQGHFDIAEIFARKLHKELSAYRFNSNTFRDDLREIYNRVSGEKEAFQQQYDRETDHSRLRIRQEEWLVKIQEMIGELEDFRNYRN